MPKGRSATRAAGGFGHNPKYVPPVDPPSGTTYWLHDPANGLVSTTPSETNLLEENTAFVSSVSDGTRTMDAMRILVTDDQSNIGMELVSSASDINTGTPFNRSLFFRFWLKFDDDYLALDTGAGYGKLKIGRTANGSLGLCTFYYNPGSWEMGELYDNSDVDRLQVTVQNKPQVDTTLRNWNEFIFEIVYPPDSAHLSDSYFKVWRNGSVIGTSSSAKWFSSSADHRTLWGSQFVWPFPQITNEGDGGGGYIYVGPTSVTDFFYSTY